MRALPSGLCTPLPAPLGTRPLLTRGPASTRLPLRPGARSVLAPRGRRGRWGCIPWPLVVLTSAVSLPVVPLWAACVLWLLGSVFLWIWHVWVCLLSHFYFILLGTQCLPSWFWRNSRLGSGRMSCFPSSVSSRPSWREPRPAASSACSDHEGLPSAPWLGHVGSPPGHTGAPEQKPWLCRPLPGRSGRGEVRWALHPALRWGDCSAPRASRASQGRRLCREPRGTNWRRCRWRSWSSVQGSSWGLQPLGAGAKGSVSC